MVSTIQNSFNTQWNTHGYTIIGKKRNSFQKLIGLFTELCIFSKLIILGSILLTCYFLWKRQGMNKVIQFILSLGIATCMILLTAYVSTALLNFLSLLSFLILLNIFSNHLLIKLELKFKESSTTTIE
jgi:hypothetical protein